MKRGTDTTDAASREWSQLGDGLGLAGYFGSLYQNILVFRVPDHAYWYVLVVNDSSLQFDLYCKDARIVPAHSGEMADVECVGQKFRFPCWRVNPSNYIIESMMIAELPQVARYNVRCKATDTAARQR